MSTQPRKHIALGQSPREAFMSALERTGLRSHRGISYDENYLMLTLPTTRKGTAKVYQGKGIKVGHIWYWCASLDGQKLAGQDVRVRPDPWDAGTVYALVDGGWAKCQSQYFTTFHGRSALEIRIATEELRRRQKLVTQSSAISAKRLALFLESVEAEELLLIQRLKDKENRKVLGHVTGSIQESDEHKRPKQSLKDDQQYESSSQANPAADRRNFDVKELEILEEY